MRFVENILFLTGFVSLFLIPSFHGFILVHFGLIFSFYVLFLVFMKKKIYFTHLEIVYSFMLILFYCCSMVGAINSGYNSGIITSQIFLLCFLVVFLSYKLGFLGDLIDGFYYSALFSAYFIIVDSINYYLLGVHKSLISIFIPEVLLGKAGEHSLENELGILGAIFYRPCGLSWDPGLSVTGVVVAFVLYNENLIKIKKRVLNNIVMIMSIILSLSKTSIVAFIFYLLLKLFHFCSRRIRETGKNISTYITAIIILFFFFLGFFVNYTGDGNQRHLKYFSSLVYGIGSNIIDFLFGYGFTNTGYFFDEYVTWLQGGDFTLTGTAAESTLTNIFLIGGFLGSFYWLYANYIILKTNKSCYIFPLIILILVAFGYNIASSWFYIVFMFLSFSAISACSHQVSEKSPRFIA